MPISLSIPSAGCRRVAYSARVAGGPDKVCLVSRTPGTPPRSSELLCGTLSGRAVLLCVDEGGPRVCVDEVCRSGGVMVTVATEEAEFISEMMRAPLIMLSGVSDGEWGVVELRSGLRAWQDGAREELGY